MFSNGSVRGTETAKRYLLNPLFRTTNCLQPGKCLEINIRTADSKEQFHFKTQSASLRICMAN